MPPEKKKLLVTTTTFPRWKGDTDPPFVYELSKRLARDFDILVHTPHYPRALKKEVVTGVSVHRFRYFLSRYEKIAGGTAILPFLKANKLYFFVLPFFLMAQLASLARLVAKKKPDIIHAHWLVPTGFFSVLATRVFCRKCKTIIICHGADVYGLQNPLARFVKRWTINRADLLVAVSRDLRLKISKMGLEKKVDVISMGVCEKTFHPLSARASLRKDHGICGVFLLYVGRLSEKKGVRFLLEALQLLDHEGVKATLVVIGDGEERPSLQKLSHRLGISEKVRFLGSLNNQALPAYYATADIFIGPSIETSSGDTEGFGLTFVEAALAGCILVGTKVGGIADILIHCEKSFIARPCDSKDLKDAISKAIAYHSSRNDRASLPRKKLVANFGWKGIATKYAQISRDLCSRR